MHRLRPILLTAAAAILGLIPIAGSVFWGPMAFAMMGGLLTRHPPPGSSEFTSFNTHAEESLS